MGVRRAVELATAPDADGNSGGAVYTLGPLIHNPYVLDDLKKRGVKILDPSNPETISAENLKDSSVIIRAHGVSPDIEALLTRCGARVIDATCPKVKSSQLKARNLSEQGYVVFIAGEKDHAEVTGICSYIKGKYFVTADPVEAAAAAAELSASAADAKTMLLAQTTLNAEVFFFIGEAIRKYFPKLEIVNTICKATTERQAALKDLCGRVDAIIIAGGRDSANTRRLLSIAEAAGKKAWLVEGSDDVPAEIFSFDVVGLAAGASTPDSVIDGIERILEAFPKLQFLEKQP